MKPALRNAIIISTGVLLFTVLCSGIVDPVEVLDHNGKLVHSGGPAELTCSESGCHGSGNGNNSTGGLPDNGGPGSITISTVPAITASHYNPSTLYHVTVTVMEQGKGLYGFDFESLDNSGNTTLTVDNTKGTYTMTDPTHVRVGGYFNSGRKTVTHQLNGGLSNNSANFIFDWTSPASGTINWYATGIASNGDDHADASDNVYKTTMLNLTPQPTGISGQNSFSNSVNVFPTIATTDLNVSYSVENPSPVKIELFDNAGKLTEEFLSESKDAGTYQTAFDIGGRYAAGIYFLKISIGENAVSKKIIIRN